MDGAGSGVGVALALIAVADLHHEFAVGRELQDLVVPDRLHPRLAIGRTIDAADPHETLGIDVDAVLALRPLVARCVAAPGAQEIAIGIEHQDRRRGLREIRVLQGPRPMNDVDVALRVRIDVGHVSELVLRRHLGPGLVHLEHRQFTPLGLGCILRRGLGRQPFALRSPDRDQRRQRGITEIFAHEFPPLAR